MMLLCMEVDSKIFFFPNFEVCSKENGGCNWNHNTVYKENRTLLHHWCQKKYYYAVVCNAKLLIIIESMFFITSSIKFL